jgi:uncharacterized GH25 family protein
MRHLFALLLATTASAHEVWIEDLPNGQLVARFAEWGEAFEKSPGHLDSLSLPESWTTSSQAPVEVTTRRAADHFALEGATAQDATQAETIFKVIGGRPGGKGDDAGPSRRPFFYARWHVAGSGAAQPSLNLDLVPTANAGEFRLYFRGKPLPDVEVEAHSPDAKGYTLKTNADGLVQIPITAQGLYMAHVKRHREKIDGFAAGKAYTAVSHNCSVAWRQPAAK